MSTVVGEKILAQALIEAATGAYEAGLDGDYEQQPYVLVEVRVPISIAAIIRDDPFAKEAEDAIWVETFCRVCGCTEDAACDGGCSWVEDDLCSACVGKEVTPV